MTDLKNRQVRHRSWGDGIVTDHSAEYVKVHFEIGDKTFKYPDAFEDFLECTEPEIQNQVLAELNKQQEKEKSRCSEIAKQIADMPQRQKKTCSRANIAFKCNFCDGGKRKNGIGYIKACSNGLLRYNIEEAHHSWCCSEDSPCRQYYNGEISREELDSYAEDGDYVCYESQMLRNWAAFAGYVLTGENKQRPLKLNRVQTNSLAILTTRVPYAPESERFIFGVFLVDEAYTGDLRDAGYVTTSSKFRMSLPLEQAKRLPFWKYYHNQNAPRKTAWSQGLHRYVSDLQAACVLRDFAKLKKGTSEEKLAKEFLAYFCRISGLKVSALPVCDGALCR